MLPHYTSSIKYTFMVPIYGAKHNKQIVFSLPSNISRLFENIPIQLMVIKFYNRSPHLQLMIATSREGFGFIIATNQKHLFIHLWAYLLWWIPIIIGTKLRRPNANTCLVKQQDR